MTDKQPSAIYDVATETWEVGDDSKFYVRKTHNGRYESVHEYAGRIIGPVTVGGEKHIDMSHETEVAAKRDLKKRLHSSGLVDMTNVWQRTHRLQTRPKPRTFRSTAKKQAEMNAEQMQAEIERLQREIAELKANA